MTLVFPKNSATDELLSCTAVFNDRAEALPKSRLEKEFNSVEGIRQQALVDPLFLARPPYVALSGTSNFFQDLSSAMRPANFGVSD